MALTSPEILIHSAWQAECIYWCFAELEFDRAGEAQRRVSDMDVFVTLGVCVSNLGNFQEKNML